MMSFSQSKRIEKLKDQTVKEAKILYRSEMASWHGTDAFMEKFSERKSDIGGYFSYPEEDKTKCVFFSKEASPKIIGTIAFDSIFSVEEAIIDGSVRSFTEIENKYYQIRTLTLQEVRNNKDGLYSFYKDTNLNLVPIISGNEKKVYILTGTSKNGVILFGNDYLLTFDTNNKILNQKKLHKSLLTMEYKGSESAMHSHLPEYDELISATDICTLMLNQKFTNWNTYYVMSEDYVSIWDCKRSELIVMTKKAWEKMSENINKLEEKKN